MLFPFETEVPLAGMEAMEALSVEAGYRHWPADLQQSDTPVQAGGEQASIVHNISLNILLLEIFN